MTANGNYDAARQDVARIQRELDNTIETIRTNKRFTDDARRVEIAKATLAASRKVTALREAAVNERNAKRESLERSIFGISGTPTAADLMLMRDSRDRAAKITSEEEARTVLKLSAQAGDTFMARAVAQVAVHKSWTDTVNTYADQAGTYTRNLLEQLAEIPSGRNTGMADNAVFRVRMPNELSNVRDDGHLRYIAEGSDDSFLTNMESGDYLGASARA